MQEQLRCLDLGMLDVGFVRPPSPLPSSVVLESVFEEEVVLAVSNGHALSCLPKVKPQDLRGESFILPNHGRGVSFFEHTMAVGAAGGFTPHIVENGRDFLTILNMVAVEIGIAIVPNAMTCIHLPGVCFRRLESISIKSRLALAFRKHDKSPAVSRFVESVKSLKDGQGNWLPLPHTLPLAPDREDSSL